MTDASKIFLQAAEKAASNPDAQERAKVLTPAALYDKYFSLIVKSIAALPEKNGKRFFSKCVHQSTMMGFTVFDNVNNTIKVAIEGENKISIIISPAVQPQVFDGIEKAVTVLASWFGDIAADRVEELRQSMTPKVEPAPAPEEKPVVAAVSLAPAAPVKKSF